MAQGGGLEERAVRRPLVCDPVIGPTVDAWVRIGASPGLRNADLAPYVYPYPPGPAVVGVTIEAVVRADFPTDVETPGFPTPVWEFTIGAEGTGHTFTIRSQIRPEGDQQLLASYGQEPFAASANSPLLVGTNHIAGVFVYDGGSDFFQQVYLDGVFMASNSSGLPDLAPFITLGGELQAFQVGVGFIEIAAHSIALSPEALARSGAAKKIITYDETMFHYHIEDQEVLPSTSFIPIGPGDPHILQPQGGQRIGGVGPVIAMRVRDRSAGNRTHHSGSDGLVENSDNYINFEPLETRDDEGNEGDDDA